MFKSRTRNCLWDLFPSLQQGVFLESEGLLPKAQHTRVMERSTLRLAGVVLLLCVGLCASTNPGMKIRVTRNGINYMNRVAQGMLRERFQAVRFPDMSSSSGKTSFSATNIRVLSVSNPSSSISLRPDRNGLTWTLSNIGISLHANYRAVKRGWIRLSSSGSVSASVSGASMSMTTGFGESSIGQPTISQVTCSSRINSVRVRFHGRWSWLINLFKGWIGRKMKDALQPQICRQVQRIVDEKAKTVLASMKMTSDLGRYFYISYKMIAPPRVTSSYLEIWNKGTVYSKSGKREPPFSPQTIPASDSTRMVYFWITQYSFNTLLYQAYTSGLLKYQITKPLLPPGDQPSVDMICGQNCIGAAFPQDANKYSGSSVDVGLECAALPIATLTTNRLTIDISAAVDLRVRSPSNRLSDLATLNVSVSLTFEPNVRGSILGGRITRHSLELSDVRLANGGILKTPPVLDTILTRLVGIAVIPKVNVLAAQGVQLPSADGFSLRNTGLNIKQGYLMIGTDMAVNW